MSRSRQRIVLAAAAALLAAPAGPARGAAVALQADAQHSGYVRGGGPQPPLRRRWQVRLPADVSYPVVAGGRVFVTVSPYTPDGVAVVALDARTGRRLWTRDVTPVGGDLYAALAYDAGRLFVTRDASEGDPSILALSPADGHVLWGAQPGDVSPSTLPVAAGGGALYVPLAGVVALRETDGAQLWRESTDRGVGGSVALGGDLAFTALGCPPHLLRLRRADGGELPMPATTCHGGGAGVPVYADGRVLLPGPSDTAGIYDPQTGGRTAPLSGGFPPAVARGLAIVRVDAFPDDPEPASGGYGYRAVDLRTGRARWTFRGDGYLDSLPLVVGRTVYIGSGSGQVAGVDLLTGRRRWSGDAGAPVPEYQRTRVPSALAAAGGLLFVPALHRLVAFGPARGRGRS